jgi:hypothetical protein
MIDFAGDRRTRSVVFILRMIAAVFFVAIFGGISFAFRSSQEFDPIHLWDFALSGMPGLFPFLVMAVAVYLVILAHELVHVALLRLNGARSVSLRIDRIVPRASAPDWYFRRGSALVYAIGPFMILSVVGMILLITVPLDYLAWVFIPIVANGVVSAADFVVIAWLSGVPPDGLVVVTHEGTMAFAPRS